MGKPTDASSVKKSGGSALKRLKTTLKTAGLIGPTSAHATKISKKKSQKRQAELHSARKDARTQLRTLETQSRDNNPFEMKFSKPKHEVLNRKVKGVVGKPGLQKKKGEELRKKTLAVELGRRNKESAFVDRRFGEGDASMSFEDKMLERFMKEKTKRSDRSSVYNLEEETLTHMGHSLADDDAFLDAGLQRVDEDSDDGQIDRDTVKYTHFGGFDEEDDDPNRKKSKNEIMKEVIAKSKMHKRERQKQKEDDLDLAAEVDAELDDIRSLLNITDKNKEDKPRRAPLPSQAQALAAAGIQAAEPSTGRRRDEDAGGDDNDDDYDKFVRELAYDRRAKPTDRLKTEEEIAQEEKGRLEKLERDRVRRMQGLPTEDEERDATAKKEAGKKGKAGGAAAKRATQADDLGDEQYGLVLDEQIAKEEEMPLTYKNGVLVNQTIFMRKKRRDDNEDEEDGEEEGSEVDSDEDEDEDEEGSEDGQEGEEVSGEEDEDEDEEEDEEDENEVDGADLVDALGELDEEENDENSMDVPPASARTRKSPISADALSDEYASSDEEDDASSVNLAASDSESSPNVQPHQPDPSAATELPYTFKAPKSHTDFLSLTQNRSAADISTIVQRLRVLHNPKLGGNNKEVLGRIFIILLEHLDYLSSGVADSNDIDLATLDALSIHIIQLSQTFQPLITQWALTKITKLHTRVSKSTKPAFPPTQDLITLKLLGHIFSTSDLSHPVITPAMIVMARLLGQGAVKDLRSVASGVWICEVLWEWVGQSKRFVPEVVNFLESVVVALVPNVPEPVPGGFPVSAATPDGLRIGDLGVEGGEKIPFGRIFGRGKGAGGGEEEEGMKISVLVGAVQLLGRFARLWGNEGVGVAFVEVFEPVLEVLRAVDVGDGGLEGVGKEAVTTVVSLIEGLIASAKLKRRPLQLQKKKPIPIATYVPKFQEHYSIDRKRTDPNTERAQNAKLQFQYKKEFKGAVRELRKDAAFVARKRMDKQKEKDAEYKRKMDRIMGQLGSQEGAMRGYEREAKKAKKRR
ncbi:nucleolar complex protein 14 [Rhizophlyctis rosea]|nr:nucleolar complex protein 14 [Rhizophlyctis rosea]